MGRLINRRIVDNPLYTDGLKYASEAVKPRRGSVVFTTERPKQEMAKVHVEENIIARIGALCFIRKREAHHEYAGQLFKTLYEARYGAGNPAMDPGRIQVDTSPTAHDSGMVDRLHRTYKIREAEVGLGQQAFGRLVGLLVLEIPAGEGLHWRYRSAMVETVLRDLDDLCVVWKLKTAPRKGCIGGTGLEPAA